MADNEATHIVINPAKDADDLIKRWNFHPAQIVSSMDNQEAYLITDIIRDTWQHALSAAGLLADDTEVTRDELLNLGGIDDAMLEHLGIVEFDGSPGWQVSVDTMLRAEEAAIDGLLKRYTIFPRHPSSLPSTETPNA
jgi:hypothetical protein